MTRTTAATTPGETDDGSGSIERPPSGPAALPAAPTSDLPVVSPSVPAAGDHPPAGTAFPGEGIGGDAAEQLQQSVDAGHQPWRLDEDAVARAFVSGRFGWSQPTITHDGPYLAVATGPNGQRVSLQLSQPARKNNGGVWVVESGLWL
ncbi:acyl transferase [Nocardia africana]|uniref:Acyl transferase n=1 Tax=Nocardia africana TaxID=134964 RepID=A0ABW6NEE9_9NOCA